MNTIMHIHTKPKLKRNNFQIWNASVVFAVAFIYFLLLLSETFNFFCAFQMKVSKIYQNRCKNGTTQWEKGDYFVWDRVSKLIQLKEKAIKANWNLKFITNLFDIKERTYEVHKYLNSSVNSLKRILRRILQIQLNNI